MLDGESVGRCNNEDVGFVGSSSGSRLCPPRGLKIIREGDDYFLIHQGEIQRHLGSRTPQPGTQDPSTSLAARHTGDEIMVRNECQMGILDRILFFIGDLETASAPAKRGRLL